jgi:hypothetical protein
MILKKLKNKQKKFGIKSKLINFIFDVRMRNVFGVGLKIDWRNKL